MSEEPLIPKADNTYCLCTVHAPSCGQAYLGQMKARPWDMYIASSPENSFDVKSAKSSQVQFYLPPDGKHKIATVWVEAGKLYVQLDHDTIWDVVFLGQSRPRSVGFQTREYTKPRPQPTDGENKL